MNYLVVYLASLMAFLAVDAVWLTVVMRALFERHVGALLRPEVQMASAAGFYAVYILGILYFCTLPGLRENSLGTAALNGAVLGFLAYGTYEFTNMATLKGWSWAMVATDTTWGVVLTALTAVVGVSVGRWMGLGAG